MGRASTTLSKAGLYRRNAKAKHSKSYGSLVPHEARKKIFLDEYEIVIMYGMARYLWVQALMLWLDPATGGPPIHRWPPGLRQVDSFEQFYDTLEHVTHDGDTWDDASPATPAATYNAALDLARLLALTPTLGAVEMQLTPPVLYFAKHPMTELFMMAMEAHTGQGYDLGGPIFKGDTHFYGKEFPDIHAIDLEYDPKGHRPVMGAHLAYRFGSGIAAEALQVGYRQKSTGPLLAIGAWYDDHKGRGALDIPAFEISFNGSELAWEGGSARGGGSV